MTMERQDFKDIQQNNWLSDNVIDKAMDLIKQMRPEMGGLYACGAVMYMNPLSTPMPGQFI